MRRNAMFSGCFAHSAHNATGVKNSAFGQQPAFSAPKDKKSDLLQPEEVIGYFAEFFDILVIISRHHNVFVFLLKRFEPV